MDSLAAVVTISGSLRIVGCPFRNLSFTPTLHSILGSSNSFAVLLEDNYHLAGSFKSNFPKLTSSLTGGLYAQNNTLMCVNQFPGNSNVAFNAPLALCGCTNPMASNYLNSATIDNGMCVFSKCAFVVCSNSSNPCVLNTCDNTDGICKEAYVNVSAMVPCNDGLNYTDNDMCVAVNGGTVQCAGVDVCASLQYRDAYCDSQLDFPANACYVLNDCLLGVCSWTTINGTRCDADGLAYTIDTCLEGDCVNTGLDICYQPSEYLPPNQLPTAIPRSLQLYMDATCVLNYNRTAFDNDFDLGGSISFSLSAPMMFNDTVSPIPSTTTAAVVLYGTSILQDSSLAATAGFYEVQLLPSQAVVQDVCRGFCFELQLMQARSGQTSQTNGTSQSYLDLCRINSRLGPGQANKSCATNLAAYNLCYLWGTVYNLCALPLGAVAQVAVSYTNFNGIMHSYTLPLYTDSVPGPQPLITFSVNGGAGVGVPPTGQMEVQNFDIRSVFRYSYAWTDATGQFNTTFQTAVETSAAMTQQMITVVPFAVTDGVQHVFLTGAEGVFYQETSTVSFGDSSSVAITDNSTYTLSGRVTLGNLQVQAGSSVTVLEATTLQLVNSTNCPVFNVTICIATVNNPSDAVQCDDTDVDGYYNFTVIRGSAVNITVSLDNHTFQNVSPNVSLAAIASNVVVNFVDTTVLPVRVQYGGGACLNNIGQALFSITALNGNPSCNIQGSLLLPAPNVLIHLPSQDYNVTLLDVNLDGVSAATEFYYTPAGVLRYFEGNDPNLTPVTGQAGLNRTLLQSDYNGTGSAVPVVSWQYHVVPLVNISVPNQVRPDCLASNSLLVLATSVQYAVDVYLEEQFYTTPQGVIICTAVPGSVSVDESVSGGAGSTTSYVLPVTYMDNGYPAPGGNLLFPVVAGYPNTVAPYATEIRVTYSSFIAPYNGQGWQLVPRNSALGRSKVVVIVTGNFPQSTNGNQAFLIPEYVPLLILRRPPGDHSFAEFETSHMADIDVRVMSSMTESHPTERSLNFFTLKKAEKSTGAGGVEAPITTLNKNLREKKT
jgi:hypothetical protein